MKLPRDISARVLIKSLRVLDYKITRQKGSHIRISSHLNGEHHETIPNHDPIKVSTLNSILKSIAAHHRITVEDLLKKLDI